MKFAKFYSKNNNPKIKESIEITFTHWIYNGIVNTENTSPILNNLYQDNYTRKVPVIALSCAGMFKKILDLKEEVSVFSFFHAFVKSDGSNDTPWQ